MIFEGKVTKAGTSAKPTTKLSSNAFDIAKNASIATHIRLRDTNEFIPLNEDIVIKRKKDENGNPKNEVVHFSRIDNNEKSEFVCVREGKESVIDGQFYTQVVFMKKNDKGSYLRCDDGCYVHKAEAQIPAYQKVPLYGDVKLSKPVHNYEFYVETEVLIYGDGNKPKKITLPNNNTRFEGGYEYFIDNERIRRKGDAYEYFTDAGDWVKCKYEKGVDTRTYVTHILLDNSTIVDIKKLKEVPNGDLMLEGINGEDIIIGKNELKLHNSIVEGSSMEPTGEIIIPHNVLKQRVRLEEGLNLAFRWTSPDSNGLTKVDVNRNRTKAVFTYSDGHRVIYAQHDVDFVTKPGDKVIRVQKLNIVDLGKDGIKIGFLEKVVNVAQNIKFENGKPSEYEINGRKITAIKWHEVGGYDQIAFYTIDGVLVSDVEWQHGEVKSCKLHLKDEDGNEKVVQISDLKSSQYRHYAITYEVVEKVEDIKIEKGKVSFKMGDYKFIDAEIKADGTIGKCILRHNGKDEEIDLSTDERFKQLKPVVDVALYESRIIPLVQSQLVEKKDGKYQLVADVVQNEEMKDIKIVDGKITEGTKNNGVAKATVLENVDQALKAQDKFKNKPFKTIVIDQNGTKHSLSDFNTKFEGAVDFELSNDILVDIIGKNKIEIKKGELVVDAKKAKGRTDDMVVAGFWLCSNPIGLIFGIPMLFAGAAYGVGSSINRSIKEGKLETRDVEDFKRAIQNNATKVCQNEINKLVAGYKREIEAYKKIYSQEECNEKIKELREDFKFKYVQEVAKLQILGGGAIKCEFDPMKKEKLTPTNHLAYLEYMKKREELENGKADAPNLSTMLATELKGLEGENRVIREVELLQQYGGKQGQLRAHKLKMDNLNTFRELEDKKRALEGKAGIEPEDYKKQLITELNEGRMVWGGIEDKLEAFKNSVEYLKADKKERKELLAKQKETLEKEAKSVKINTIQFNEMLDKDGNALISNLTQSLVAYMEYVDLKFYAGNTKHIDKFTFDFYEKLNDDEKDLHTTTTLSDATARRVGTTKMRKVEFDRAKNKAFVNLTAENQKTVDQKVDNLKEEGERYRNLRDYEKLYKLSIALEIEEEKFKIDCENLEKRIANTPNEELNLDATKQALEQIEESRKNYAKQKRLAQGAIKLVEEQYSQQVKAWALDEFAKFHNVEYEVYRRSTLKAKGGEITNEQLLEGFYARMYKDREKRDSYSRELETYKIKHNVDENISAETFCELHEEEFNKFIEEHNAQSLNNEMARCYFYAHCKRDNPMRVEQFNRYFAKKRMEKAKERVKNKTLVAHEQKIIKSKGTNRTVEASASVAPTITAEASAGAGLTA